MGRDQPDDRRRKVGIGSLVQEVEAFINVPALGLLIAKAEQDSSPCDGIIRPLKSTTQIVPGLGMTTALARAKGTRVQLLGGQHRPIIASDDWAPTMDPNNCLRA